MITRPTALRTLAATLMVVAGSLSLSTGSASAAPSAPSANQSCHSLSSGFKTWTGYQVTDLACAHAHSIGTKWSSACGRSTRPTAPMHCTIIEHVDGRDMHFSCTNHKAPQSPAHYNVHCTHEHRVVMFTFFPYGL
jgi:hypothetical protein